MLGTLLAGGNLLAAQARLLGREATVRGAILLAEVEPRRRAVVEDLGGSPPGPRVVVFCHYDPAGRLAEHARRYLEALLAAGLSVVFVSNAGRLEAAAIDWLRPRCARVIIRRNIGFDFGAWRDAIALAELPAAGTRLLVLANDSVYGPLRPLAPLLERMDFEAADVWAMTDSWQLRFHLQSYLVAFGPAALRHPVFGQFWAGVRDLRSKAAVVRRYEVGMTQTLLAAGLRCGALWPYVETLAAFHAGAEEAAAPLSDSPLLGAVRQAARQRILGAATQRVPMNPTAELWRPLLQAGFPFLKRELLRRNPSRIPDLAAWIELARAVSPGDTEVILRDLRSSLRQTAP
ncbi:rhamnan synthesis F family protein [Paracraurococcus lichenis]|uniref:Rhamnan synthesis F family protein n=1 Tax=Paracraurococcus lichenis TaxID=3064888 RepID=A0ABT9E415_9PROT|nr:rhamnan synthesis F family protein [Paracraurococcus sp. LOR1-02]MDO9710898.1 rhamnan synthesis F family protein [Paracraurococcus sp. LOR1-02]